MEPGTKPAMTDEPLEHVLDHVSHLLPAQGPISVFIHHNTLHAFDHLPFEEAVVEAGLLYGCEPFLSERRYRAEFARGRIRETDVAAELERALGARGDERVAGLLRRAEMRRRIAVYGIPEASGQELAWHLSEGDARRRFRDDIPNDAREAVAAARGWVAPGDGDESETVGRLWDSCVAAIARSEFMPDPPRARTLVRHRDLLLEVHGVDIDEWVHPLLIRFTAAYLDQGLAEWAIPGRERGMFACFAESYGIPLARMCAPWTRDFPSLVDAHRSGDGSASLAESLVDLGVAVHERHDFLRDTALALRGFAGMVSQVEQRPDRVPTYAVPARLVDFLAIRLLLERAALRYACSTLGLPASLDALRGPLRRQVPAASPSGSTDRAWSLFHLAQICAFDSSMVDALEPAQVTALERELAEFDSVKRRELLHCAYENHLRDRFYSALTDHGADRGDASPGGAGRDREARYQAVFCIDEREESIRRHLEEVDPDAETFGAAGFYGVAMYYRGATDAHPRPLCPVVIRPDHYIAETHGDEDDPWTRWSRSRRRLAGRIDRHLHFGSHTLVRGAVLMTVVGALSVIPLVLRVLFPSLRIGLAKATRPWVRRRTTRLAVERRDDPPSVGKHAGFTVQEMSDVVASQLENIGVVGRFAPLVLIIGHGSVSLNNPHESAHDCGACGGGRGGPNARAFAQMANDSRVRALLRERGIEIPDSTFFVGGERNTASNAITLFDVDLVPEDLTALFAHAHRMLDAARNREAHERCRRFEHTRVDWNPSTALRHVEMRANDLAQPRPEYGHATNAVCFVGRRVRTRGLFLDRRAFLVSYDDAADPEGKILARLLDAGGPVIAGINLEYYFSYVDPTGYGCGTKLPHNVTSLVGVMDGAQSDLRPGLPWQMVEVHEPVRMSIVVECLPEKLAAYVAGNPLMKRLVDNRWMFVACLDPASDRLWEYRAGGFEPREESGPIPVVRGGSRAVYEGKRGHIPFARIAPTEISGSMT